MDKFKILNTSLVILSTLLSLLAIFIFVVSFLGIITFFSFNSIQFQKIFEGKEFGNILIFNPSIFEVKDFDMYGNFSIFNRTFEIIKIENIRLKSNESREVTPVYNFSSIQEELIKYSLEVFNKTKDENIVREEISRELSMSKFNILIRINMQDFMKLEFFGEINASKLISFSV
ncbi:MAG: hypothetical protein QW197_01880 [Candidatus Aenigmatarchaeota archaeon]